MITSYSYTWYNRSESIVSEISKLVGVAGLHESGRQFREDLIFALGRTYGISQPPASNPKEGLNQPNIGASSSTELNNFHDCPKCHPNIAAWLA
jgi:hypothetical protein